MRPLFRMCRYSFFHRRLVNTQTQLAEPTMQMPARMEKKDVFCEHIKAITPPIDWNLVRGHFSKSKVTAKGLKFGFEIRSINCLITAEPPVTAEVAESLLRHIDPKEETIGQNPIFDLHLAALMGRVNAKHYADLIKKIVAEVPEKNSSLTKYKAYVDSILSLSTTSRENCELAVSLADLKGQLSRQLSLCCLSHGLHEKAIATYPRIIDNDLEMQPWLSSFHAFEFHEEAFRKFLRMLRSIAGPVSPSCGKSFEDLLRKAGYEVCKTDLDERSCCTDCGTQMSGITAEEYETCKHICKDRVLNRGDTFLNSTPSEVNSFLALINKTLKSGNYYGLVIDGLNVAHVTQPLEYSLDPAPRHGRVVKVTKNTAVLFNSFKKILNNSLKTWPRLLVIGRKHMRGWPGLMDLLLSKRDQVDVFFLENISEDDPFIIYAAMQSPQTYVMSNDFFRDHKFLMDDCLFERWLRCRLVRAPKDKHSFSVPPKHENCINISNDWRRIHVPVGYNNTSFISWLCCHKQ